jgi:hypothetical protein
MKKLILAATLCVAALAVIPVSLAGAAEFKGSCKVNGVARFVNGTKLGALTSTVEYEFQSKKLTNLLGEEKKAIEACTGTGFEPTEVEVQPGKVEASCTGKIEAANNLVDGAVTVTFAAGAKNKTEKFALDLTGSEGGTVKATIEESGGEGVKGEVEKATFTKSGDQFAAECATTGVKKLQFEAEGVKLN